MQLIMIICGLLVTTAAEPSTVDGDSSLSGGDAVRSPSGPLPPCGQPDLEPCCMPHPTPGCQEPACCIAVCQFDEFCCQGQWDPVCVAHAQVLCAGLCCMDDLQCQDPNPCVMGFCEPLLQQCFFQPLPDGEMCESDGDLCTLEACSNTGTCQVIQDVNDFCQPADPPCEGGEICDPALGICVSLPDAPAGVPCEFDGQMCTLDACDGLGMCQPIDIQTCASECPFCDQPCDPKTGLCPCAEVRSNGLWSQDIWNLPGPNPYPDNNGGVFNLGAVVGTFEVLLDISVEIVSLCVINGGILRPFEGLGPGMRNITVIGPEGILISSGGSLLVSGTQMVDASAGTVTIGGGGTYSADPAAGGIISAMLTAGNIEMLEGDPGGVMNLSSEMSVHSLGDFTMNGNGYDDKGDCTPPDLIVSNTAGVTVDGDFVMLNAAAVTYTSSESMVLVGDFVNESLFPEFFDFDGTLLLSRSGSQSFENGGEDFGRCLPGFVDNFAIDTLELVDGTTVNVVDLIDNQDDGSTTCDEALYVDTLIVGTAATLNTSGCPVYYNQLTNNGSIPGLGTDVREIVKADFNGDCVVNASDLAQLLGAWGACPGPCPPSCAEDLSGDCMVDAADLAQLLGNWGSTN